MARIPSSWIAFAEFVGPSRDRAEAREIWELLEGDCVRDFEGETEIVGHLRTNLIELQTKHNLVATSDTTEVATEYLEIVAVRE
jgi:hypothetical protein